MNPSRSLRLSLVLFVGFIASCGESKPAADRTGGSQGVRIVSLSSAISRTLVDLQLDDFIVGRTPYCTSVDQSIATVGDLLNVNYELLIRLQPTHVLVQPPASGIDPHLVSLAEEKGWTLGQWRLNGLEDIEALIRDLPSTVFSSDAPEYRESTERAAVLLNDLALAISPGGMDIYAEPILMVNEVDPVMAFGDETYLHDILITLGGKNIVSSKGWAQLSLEDVVRLNPSAIIIVRPGAQDADLPFTLAGPLAQLGISAIHKRRIAVLSHPDSFLPSSGMIGVARNVRDILQQWAEPNQ